jgi:hypothetical protein
MRLDLVYAKFIIIDPANAGWNELLNYFKHCFVQMLWWLQKWRYFHLDLNLPHFIVKITATL